MDDTGVDTDTRDEDNCIGKNGIALSIGLTVGMLLLIALIIDFFLYRRRLHDKSKHRITVEHFTSSQRSTPHVLSGSFRDDTDARPKGVGARRESKISKHQVPVKIETHPKLTSNGATNIEGLTHGGYEEMEMNAPVYLKGWGYTDTRSVENNRPRALIQLEELSARSLLSRTASLQVRRPDDQIKPALKHES